ncbi:MAG TPA: YciI family protein [bacterium]|nr:YciI family protein [bacterium]
MKYLCLIYNDKERHPADGRDAVTIRVHNGRLSVVTGGGGAAGEQLRDVLVIRARDLNDAIRMASRMPEAQLGSIEIRPVDDPE